MNVILYECNCLSFYILYLPYAWLTSYSTGPL
jgi:hypothetical protein